MSAPSISAVRYTGGMSDENAIDNPLNLDIPDHLQYSEEHVWVDDSVSPAIVGITAYAEQQLGELVFIDLPGSMDISGVLQTIFNVDYVLPPIAADNFVMDSSFGFSKSVMKFVENRKNIPLKDVFLFWTKVKKRSNSEVLDNNMALMKIQGLKILDSTIPDLCRYDKELSARTRTYFRCSLLPPPAGQLKGSGLQELANELIVKFNLYL